MKLELESSSYFQTLVLSLRMSLYYAETILRKKYPILKIGFCKLEWGQGIWILKASEVISYHLSLGNSLKIYCSGKVVFFV